MRNPYLWQQSLRATIFFAIFPLLAAKIATLLLLLYVASQRAFSVDPITGLALMALAASSVLDLWTIYHLTTRWHRLNRHPWVIMPSALANLALTALAIVPAPFAIMLSALQSLLGDTSVVSVGIWVPLGVAVILAFLQLVVSLRLTLRLRQGVPAPR